MLNTTVPSENGEPIEGSEPVASVKGSGGPRSAEGKAASARNATTHGLTSGSPVAAGERAEEFAEFLQGWVDYFCPIGVPEEELVRNMALDAWRKRRIQRFEAAIAKTLFGAFEETALPPIDEPLVEKLNLDRVIRLLEDLETLDDSTPLDSEESFHGVLVIWLLRDMDQFRGGCPFPETQAGLLRTCVNASIP